LASNSTGVGEDAEGEKSLISAKAFASGDKTLRAEMGTEGALYHIPRRVFFFIMVDLI
jgi:hypothetical protein